MGEVRHAARCATDPEPELDQTKTVKENIEVAVQPIRDLLTRFDELSAKLGEDLSADQMDKVMAEHARVQDEIEAKSNALMSASQKLGEMMYAKAQAEQGAAGADAGGGAGAAGASEAKRPKDDDVVDADFKEVKRG